MYQSPNKHILSAVFGDLTPEDQNVLWHFFVGIGDHWALGDDAAGYRTRFDNFLSNRSDFDPLYTGYYTTAAFALRNLIDQYGEVQAYRILLEEGISQNEPVVVDKPTLEMLRKRIVDEFLTVRLAFGGFRAFGATNYRGYFGGALIAGRPVPYRT
jgi:hypothetical protein